MGSGRSVKIAIGMEGMQEHLEQYSSLLQARENEESIAEELRGMYIVTDQLRDHIEKPDVSTAGRTGIKGAHYKPNFLLAIEQLNAKITNIVPNSQLDGVEKIFYKMPKKDAQGKLTEEFQSSTKMKTVYDPGKIPTEEYIQRGIQAANNAAKNASNGKLGREWVGVDDQGVCWHGYCDDKDSVTSFYPED